MDSGIVLGAGLGVGIPLAAMVGLLSSSWTEAHTTVLVVAVAVGIVAGSCTMAFLTANHVFHRSVASVAGLRNGAPFDIIDLRARDARATNAEIGAASSAVRLMDRLGASATTSQPDPPVRVDIGKEWGE